MGSYSRTVPHTNMRLVCALMTLCVVVRSDFVVSPGLQYLPIDSVRPRFRAPGVRNRYHNRPHVQSARDNVDVITPVQILPNLKPINQQVEDIHTLHHNTIHQGRVGVRDFGGVLRHRIGGSSKVAQLPYRLPERSTYIPDIYTNNQPVHKQVYEEDSSYYKFLYEISDPDTYNVHGRQEERRGDVVKGKYWLLEPTGYIRKVEYIADKSGFHPVITRLKLPQHLHKFMTKKGNPGHFRHVADNGLHRRRSIRIRPGSKEEETSEKNYHKLTKVETKKNKLRDAASVGKRFSVKANSGRVSQIRLLDKIRVTNVNRP